LQSRLAEGISAQELALVVRSDSELPRALAALQAADLVPQVLDQAVATQPGKVSVCTMHLAKGLEFKAVAVMACDDEIVPSQQRLAEIGDDADLDVVYETERHLLYVACTRARDRLLITGVEPLSEFLDDMN
jgi:superfamily I DNA/RNA helicase